MIVTSSIFDIPGLNYISVNIALLHITNLVNYLDFTKCLQVRSKTILIDFCYLYQETIKQFLHLLMFIASSVLYQELAFEKYICKNCVLIDHFYKSELVIFGITCGSYFALNVFYIYTFISRRLELWKSIAEFANLFAFDAELTHKFECLIGNYNYISMFVHKWLHRDTEEMKETCYKNSHAAYMHLVTKLNRLDGSINYSECRYALLELGCPEANVHSIWKILSINDIVDKETIYLSLWEIYRERRLFAAMNYTDRIVVKWAVLFGALFLYGIGIVFIIDIFNYDEAFGTGIDVFKIYLLASTYLIGIFKNKIQFIIAMIHARPYNIHDILEYDGEVWEVEDIKLSDTLLQGSCSYTVPNNSLVEKGIKNLTRGVAKDSFTINVPYSFHNAEAKIDDLMKVYLANNKDSICAYRIDCKRISTDSVSIAINWQYAYEIFSVGTMSDMRKKIYSYIYTSLEHDLEKLWLEFLIVNGGGYNSFANKRKFD
jgi:hypothetical protein